MDINLKPIAFIKSSRTIVSDDNWLSESCEIILEKDIPSEAIKNIDLFSHLEIIYVFDKVNMDSIVYSGHPRENKSYPEMGIFAQRKKDRPNRIGATIVTIREVKDRSIVVEGLDAIDGTPVIDIKPVFNEFLPKEKVREPEWVSDLMRNYF